MPPFIDANALPSHINWAEHWESVVLWEFKNPLYKENAAAEAL